MSSSRRDPIEGGAYDDRVTPALPIDELPRASWLRVHHIVDGARLGDRSAIVHQLAPLVTDGGRRGVPIASPDEVEDFLGRCSDGLARWLALRPVERSRLVDRTADAFEAATLELAEAMADDFGMPCADAVIATKACIDEMRRVIGLGEQAVPILPLGLHVIVLSTRLAGTVFTGVAWPLVLGGSTIVLCPDHAAPRTVTLLAELAGAAGLPDGVVNVIHGDTSTIEALAASPMISGVAGVGAHDLTDRVEHTAERFGKRIASVSTGA